MGEGDFCHSLVGRTSVGSVMRFSRVPGRLVGGHLVDGHLVNGQLVDRARGEEVRKTAIN
jgi:hypothetical protein